jgi:hypothetical protein
MRAFETRTEVCLYACDFCTLVQLKFIREGDSLSWWIWRTFIGDQDEDGNSCLEMEMIN